MKRNLKWLCMLLLLSLTLSGCSAVFEKAPTITDEIPTENIIHPKENQLQNKQTQSMESQNTTLKQENHHMIPENVELEIKNAYRNKYIASVENMTLDSISLNVRCVFDDVYALYITSWNFAYADVITQITVNDLEFTFGSSRQLEIYCNGEFYKLQEAFENGIITEENLLVIHENYRQK